MSSSIRTSGGGLCKTLLHRIQRSAFSALALKNDIQFSQLSIETTTTPKIKPPFDKTLKFGAETSDHLLYIDYDDEHGWHAPKIQPYHQFDVDPAASVLHYALEAFDGFKSYLDAHNQIRIFRPEMNLQRLSSSCDRLALPDFNHAEFLQCISALLVLEKAWIPELDGYSLYVRPTIIGTNPSLSVDKATAVRLYVILFPVGPYYPEGFNAISLYATQKYARAWPGAYGGYKLGANYGPTIRAQKEAAKLGYTQIMWLYNNQTDMNMSHSHARAVPAVTEEQIEVDFDIDTGIGIGIGGDARSAIDIGEHCHFDYVTEVGTMNQFFYWVNAEGDKELITAPLDMDLILPGVTRDSVLQLCREWDEFKVTERAYTMAEVLQALSEGRVLEAFGAGTAAIISSVKAIGYQNKRFAIPVNPMDKTAEIGPLAERLWTAITDIQYGRVGEHPWSIVVEEE